MRRIPTLDTFEGECPAPLTAGLFCPIMAVALFGTISDEDRLNREIESFGVSVAKFIRNEPTAALLLPNLAHLHMFRAYPRERSRAAAEIIALEIAELRTKKRALGVSTSEGISRSDDDEDELHRKQFERNTVPDLTCPLLFRKLFRKKRDTLGLCNLVTHEQDEISFLHGAHAPIILRPLANDNYRFIGEACVYGIMHGEAEFGCRPPAPIMIG